MSAVGGNGLKGAHPNVVIHDIDEGELSGVRRHVGERTSIGSCEREASHCGGYNLGRTKRGSEGREE